MAIIACRDASFAYEGNVVVSGLNFKVESGDYLCVVGENGSGKSTLIRGMLRLKAPQSGSVEFGEGLLPREIGYMPQGTAAQRDFPASAYEVVLSGRLGARGARPFYSGADRAAARDCMARIGISDMRAHCYRELSGGQRQRVLLARALCAAKRLILLDEPAASLDPNAAHEMYRTVEELNRRDGLTVIMVSHDIRAAVRYSARILHLSGEQEFFGAAEEYARTELGSGFIGGAG